MMLYIGPGIGVATFVIVIIIFVIVFASLGIVLFRQIKRVFSKMKNKRGNGE